MPFMILPHRMYVCNILMVCLFGLGVANGPIVQWQVGVVCRDHAGYYYAVRLFTADTSWSRLFALFDILAGVG